MIQKLYFNTNKDFLFIFVNLRNRSRDSDVSGV